ncbi:MAG: hypothetical protein ABI605_11380 [Rhizobacter sp.]
MIQPDLKTLLDQSGPVPLRIAGRTLLQQPEGMAFNESVLMAGSRCPERGNDTVIHKDGCDFCTAWGHIGSCG